MNSNINELLSLTGLESDTSIHRNATKLASNEGIAFEMQSLGLGGEVKPSVMPVTVDKTDWANAIR